MPAPMISTSQRSLIGRLPGDGFPATALRGAATPAAPGRAGRSPPAAPADRRRSAARRRRTEPEIEAVGQQAEAIGLSVVVREQGGGGAPEQTLEAPVGRAADGVLRLDRAERFGAVAERRQHPQVVASRQRSHERGIAAGSAAGRIGGRVEQHHEARLGGGGLARIGGEIGAIPVTPAAIASVTMLSSRPSSMAKGLPTTTASTGPCSARSVRVCRVLPTPVSLVTVGTEPQPAMSNAPTSAAGGRPCRGGSRSDARRRRALNGHETSRWMDRSVWEPVSLTPDRRCRRDDPGAARVGRRPDPRRSRRRRRASAATTAAAGRARSSWRSRAARRQRCSAACPG